MPQHKKSKSGKKKSTGRKKTKTQKPVQVVMTGEGFKDIVNSVVNGISSLNTAARNNKVVTNLRGASDALGLTPLADRFTGGLYSKGTDYAIKQGYGPTESSVVVMRPVGRMYKM